MWEKQIGYNQGRRNLRSVVKVQLSPNSGGEKRKKKKIVTWEMTGHVAVGARAVKVRGRSSKKKGTNS